MADDQGALEHVVMGRLRAASLLDDDDVVVWRRQPRDLAAAFADTLGALYGAASSTRTAAFLRPKNRATDLKGLYFASGSAHPGGGVPLCLASGMFAADALLEDLPRRRRVA
jgi:phytoene dehydrogenase-like protein